MVQTLYVKRCHEWHFNQLKDSQMNGERKGSVPYNTLND